jgi:hypothetical protein
VRRRPLLSLPFPEDVPALCAVLRGEKPPVPADPGRFTQAALHHQAGGFVLGALGDGRLALPAPHVERLETAVGRRAVRARALCAELHRLVPALAAATGAEPVVLKGPALLAGLYGGDPRLRPFGDLDLLVPAERLGDAVQGLAPLGFRALVEFAPGFSEIHGHDVHVRRDVGRRSVDVELHWRVGDDPLGAALGHARLRADARPFTVEGCRALGPGPADDLLVLSVHLLSDRAKRLIWVQDLTLAARSCPPPAWEAAFIRARELGLLWVLHRGLDYAAAHLGLDRPRPLPAGDPPPWGPLRAVEGLDMRASLHVGRLAALGWRERAAYLRTIRIPSAVGLRDVHGGDGAHVATLAARHVRDALRGVRRPG